MYFDELFLSLQWIIHSVERGYGQINKVWVKKYALEVDDRLTRATITPSIRSPGHPATLNRPDH